MYLLRISFVHLFLRRTIKRFFGFLCMVFNLLTGMLEVEVVVSRWEKEEGRSWSFFLIDRRGTQAEEMKGKLLMQGKNLQSGGKPELEEEGRKEEDEEERL